MIFKTIIKEDLQKLFDVYLKDIECVGPKQVAVDKDGKPVYQFLPFESFDEIDLNHEKTEYSAKTYFLPFRETLSTFHFKNGDWDQDVKYRKQQRVLVGLHPCDINALVKLDKVFAKDLFPSPYYRSRRENTFVIGIDCDKPCVDGFCASVGADVVTHGFDLFLRDIGDKYFVKIGTDRGFNVLNKINPTDISSEERKTYRKKTKQFLAGFQKSIRVENLPNTLDIEFESPVWKKWGDKCFSCGSCAMVCPTCYCYGVTEQLSMDFKTSQKVKQLYSCNLLDFAMVAGGHNFRPARETRLKYRYYHQHRGFVESFGEPKCVGCNRCGRACLANINPVDVISDLQMEL
jgi:formate hydrogenlyase subunit 6/NADH:ubiquinone oxidoreductase subunit I